MMTALICIRFSDLGLSFFCKLLDELDEPFL